MLIFDVAYMPRGTKPANDGFMFGTTREHDIYIIQRKRIKDEYRYDTSLNNSIRSAIAQSGFEFSDKQKQFGRRFFSERFPNMFELVLKGRE